jgi:hypothetical protein
MLEKMSSRVKETFNGTEMGHEKFKTSLWEIIGHTCSCFELREWPSSCLSHLSTFACIFLFGTHTTSFLKVFVPICAGVCQSGSTYCCHQLFWCFKCDGFFTKPVSLKWMWVLHVAVQGPLYSYHHSGLLLQLLLHSILDSYMSLFINCKTTY